MSTPSDNGSWTPQGGDFDAQQSQAGQGAPGQDPWAAPQDAQPAQDPWAQPQGDQQYGQASASEPFGQASAADPYGQASGASASDPYGQAPGAGQQSWTPAGGPVPSGSDPYGQPAGGPYAQPGGLQNGQQAGQQPPLGGTPDPQAQSRLVVGLLGIFLGGFGVHRFLLGYTTIGILQIVVTLLTCSIGAWWGVIEGIMVLAKSPSFERDAHGRPLTD